MRFDVYEKRYRALSPDPIYGIIGNNFKVIICWRRGKNSKKQLFQGLGGRTCGPAGAFAAETLKQLGF